MALNHIPLSCYDDDDYTATKLFYTKWYDQHRKLNFEPIRVVRDVICTFFSEDFDEEGMDKLVMLVSGMLWAIKNDGVGDDLAYNVWLAIEDFSTGEFDDLFRENDLALLKNDIKNIYDYFDANPELKG